MFTRASKLRFRRKFRMRRRQVTSFGEQTEDQLDQHLFGRLERLLPVRRFVSAWLGLMVILIGAVVAQTFALSGHYQVLNPTAGGVYTEGIIGEFTNANPLYATSLADRTVSKLIFSGLLTFDAQNELVGDLAAEWQADARGEVYTLQLRENLHWHDGKPLTADDVIFTYQTIQNADAQSPLLQSWRNVTVVALDERTVEFKLSSALASFPYGLTNGIIPKHILGDVSPADLRSVPFNSAEPVGSGPFQMQAIETTGTNAEDREVRIALSKFVGYHLGEPQLDGFTVRTFRSEENIIRSFERKELNGLAGLVSAPPELEQPHTVFGFPQTAAMMTFFRTSDGVLGNKAVRQALVRGLDTSKVRKQLNYAAPPVDAPILRGQIGYDEKSVQISYDLAAAKSQLKKAGWKEPSAGAVRQKEGKPLEFSLYAETNPETITITRELQRQWRELGVNVKVELQTIADFQITQSEHSYDAILRGIAIGPDPDVYVYWHSSQADVRSSSRLNFSEYSTKQVDVALESARTRLDPRLRAEKLKPFLDAWRTDAPAVGLYQPQSFYLTRGTVYGLDQHTVNGSSDRLANVHEWMIRRVKTTVD